MKNSKKVLTAPVPGARHCAYYLKHRDRIKAAARARYAANPDRRKASQAVYNAAHRDEIKAYKVDYYARNQDRLLAYARGHYVSRKLAAAELEPVLAKKGRS